MCSMEIVNRHSVRAFLTKDESEIRELLAPANSSLRRQSLAEARVAPGRATRRHCHPDTEEIYYILQGEGRMELEGEFRNVGEGDGIVILPGQVHGIRNSGTRELVFLCCCSPPYRDEDTEFAE